MLGSILKKLLYFVSFFVWILPRPVKAAIGITIGFLWFDVFRIRRQTAIDNVMIAYPKMPKSEAVKVARQSVRHVGYNVVELLSFPYLNKKSVLDQFEMDGEEKLRQAFDPGKGVFMISAHIANGDLATAALSHLGFPIHLISKVFSSQWLNDYWFEVRKKHGAKYIRPRKSSYDILKALKENEMVVFVLDQYTASPNGIVTEFFGVKTGTAFGLALLAERSDAVVIPAYTWRKAFGKNVIRVGDPIPFEPKETKEETLRHNTQNYANAVEKMIREHPEQWMWIHRRWKPAWTTDADGVTHHLPENRPLPR